MSYPITACQTDTITITVNGHAKIRHVGYDVITKSGVKKKSYEKKNFLVDNDKTSWLLKQFPLPFTSSPKEKRENILMHSECLVCTCISKKGVQLSD